MYATGLRAGWLAVTDPPTRTGFALTFDPACCPMVWLWGVYGGWRGLYAAGVEAWTSYPARLDQVIQAGRQLTLAPHGTFETEVEMVCLDEVWRGLRGEPCKRRINAAGRPVGQDMP